MTSDASIAPGVHTLAVVVPVFRGEATLPALLEELDGYSSVQVSAAGNRFRISEVVLVNDSGPDHSDLTIRNLAERYDYVRPVWLARNFGQHAAILAGMSSTSADWIVTMDEDGQHNPGAIGAMLDTALTTRSPLVYAEPTNEAPHGAVRNLASRVAHRAAAALGAGDLRHFHSFRPTAVRASTSTSLSPGSSTERPPVPWPCETSAGARPVTLSAAWRRISGEWCSRPARDPCGSWR
jgi:polyisoprenyl-phosphate glycosyltransferase